MLKITAKIVLLSKTTKQEDFFIIFHTIF